MQDKKGGIPNQVRDLLQCRDPRASAAAEAPDRSDMPHQPIPNLEQALDSGDEGDGGGQNRDTTDLEDADLQAENSRKHPHPSSYPGHSERTQSVTVTEPFA